MSSVRQVRCPLQCGLGAGWVLGGEKDSFPRDPHSPARNSRSCVRRTEQCPGTRRHPERCQMPGRPGSRRRSGRQSRTAAACPNMAMPTHGWRVTACPQTLTASSMMRSRPVLFCAMLRSPRDSRTPMRWWAGGLIGALHCLEQMVAMGPLLGARGALNLLGEGARKVLRAFLSPHTYPTHLKMLFLSSPN